MKTSFWQRWRPWGRTSRQARPVSRRGLRLQLEQLEDRTLLSGTPQLLADINPGSPSSSPSQMVVIGSETYFTANDGTHGNEVWKTDGTAAGTSMVADINPGSSSSYPINLTNVNGTLFFSVDEPLPYGHNDYQLWKSDGTAAGTTMVTDFGDGDPPTDFTNVNGTLFFSAYYDDGTTNSIELWKNDGTAAGTVPVSSAVSDPRFLTNVNGELYFNGYSIADGSELWKSDGTAAGTTEVKDIFPGAVTNVQYPYANSSNPGDLTNVNGTLYFSASDGNGGELWKSDGTADGTYKLTAEGGAGQLTNVNGTLFFTAADSTGGVGLWKSDGTAAGTSMVKDFNPGNASNWFPYYNPYPSYLTNVNGTLFFAAGDGTDGVELWKSDGTAVGTTMVKDINPGTTTTWYNPNNGSKYYTTTKGSYPGGLTNVNGTLYFSANDGTYGDELWKSDGTAAGTTLVQDIYPGTYTAVSESTGLVGAPFFGYANLPNSSDPNELTNLNGTLLFAANDGVHGDELWEMPAGPSLAGSPSLAFSAASATPTAGQPDTFTITARNADGTPDTTLNDTVRITSSDGKASYPASVTLTNGTAQFNVAFDTAGPQSVTATDVLTPSDTGSDSAIVVQAAAASRFTLTGFPSPAAVGTAGSFTVTAYDTYGNVATGYTGTVHFSSSDTAAVLPADATLTNGSGVFTATLNTAGYQSIIATDTQDPSITGSQTGIQVLPLAVKIETDPANTSRQMLVIDGTADSENIVLAGNGSDMSLSFNGTPLGDIKPINGYTFALVEVFGEGGNDVLDARNLALSSVLVGSSGNDSLYGGSAPNLLIGGSGSDTLYAGSAGDILIGGYTSYDSDPMALAFIMAEWDSADSYKMRVNAILNGGGLNGSYALNSSTVFDDNAIDVLYGGAGMDWFFAHTAKGKNRGNQDQVNGRTHHGEVITSI